MTNAAANIEIVATGFGAPDVLKAVPITPLVVSRSFPLA